jgi:hypothetical protein
MNATTMSKPNRAYTKTLGALAFARGIACAPALDSTLATYMGSRQIGDTRSVPELKAWITGWTEASLAAAD